VVKGLDGFSTGHRVEHEAGALTPVQDLDAELPLDVSAIPEEVDDDSVVLAVSEVIILAQHERHLQWTTLTSRRVRAGDQLIAQ
jgi:hypothetical protein